MGEEVEEAGGELSDRAAVDLPAAPLGAFSLCAVHKRGCCYHVTDSESPFRMKKKESRLSWNSSARTVTFAI